MRNRARRDRLISDDDDERLFPVSGGRIDPNLLAAFLENRLTAEERRRVIDRLNASREDYETFAEAAGVLDELRTDPPSMEPAPASAPTPAQRTRGSRWPWLLVPLAAAAAAIVVVLPSLRGTADVGQLLALAAPSEIVTESGQGALTRQLGADWSATGWSVTRGGSEAAGAASEFRIGARLADLEIALDQRDTDAAQLAAAELAALLDQVPGGTAVALQYSSGAAGPVAGTAASARASLQALLGRSTALRLGIWTEQARLAVLAGAIDYFDDAAMSALRGIAADVPQHAAQVAAVERAVETGDTAALRTAIEELVRSAAG